jgi:glycerate-2-kinase
MKIQNAGELARTQEREHVLDIAEAGLQAIDTTNAINATVSYDGSSVTLRSADTTRSYELAAYDRLFVVGVGKCSLEAARAIEEKLGNAIADGVVLDVREAQQPLHNIRSYVGTHPYPSDENISNTHKLIELLDATTDQDLVLFIISGGGSTLLCQPETGVCTDEVQIVKALYQAGASIYEINTVRKHLSKARGGNLARFAHPATATALIFSDVPGDDISFIASGPTVRDETTVADAKEVIAQYNLYDRCGFDVVPLLMETPKDDTYFDAVTNITAVSNETALNAMESRAQELGYSARVCSSCLAGEARDVAASVVSELHREEPNTVLLYGGETTVTIKGDGDGGRNQECALAALGHVTARETVASVASDGRDNGPYAGAIVDQTTADRANERGLDRSAYLQANNSQEFFEAVEDHVQTGYTGSNVADLVIALKAE